MPTSEERLYKPGKLNLWFAVSSVLMTVTILWMIAVDYHRPWHEFQDNYALGKAALAHLDYLDATRQDRLDEIQLANTRLADASSQRDAEFGVKREGLIRDIAEADLAFRKADGPWSRAQQVLQVTHDSYERLLGAQGAQHDATRAAHANLQREEDDVERLLMEKEKWEDQKKSLQTELKAIDRFVVAAQKRVTALESVASAAAEVDRQYRGTLSAEGMLSGIPLVSWLINAPLLDFVSPRNTPSRRQVNQLVLPDVRQRLNYMESYTTDRCTTCHVSIADPEFSRVELAKKLERSLPGIDEALARMDDPSGDQLEAGVSGSVHDRIRAHWEMDETDELSVDHVTQRWGELPATLQDAFAGWVVRRINDDLGLTGQRVLKEGGITEHWDRLSKALQRNYFDVLLARVNHYLTLSGRRSIDLHQPLLAHPDLDLFVDINSPHPMAKIGCTVCHEGNPQETDFVFASHTPPTHEIEAEWKDKYYVHALGVPNVTFELVEHYWDRPMRLPKHTEAGCAKCHTEITDIARFRGERKGERINLGRFLFTNVGCINCHNVDTLKGSRRVGPNLANISGKLSPAFVQPWAHFPQRFRPSTRMPHFFQQENNRSESANKLDPDPTTRTETEVAGISKYLFAVSNEWQPIEVPEGITGDAERGRDLFRSAGCLACHANLKEFGQEWISQDLVHRTGITEEKAVSQYKGMSETERVRYAMDSFVNERDTYIYPERARFDPEANYNTPVMTRFAPELSGIGSKVSFEWLYSWLIDPTHYAPDTKMPSMRLSPGEAADLSAYLMTQRNDEFVQGEFEMNARRSKMADDLIFQLLSAQRSERHSRAILADEGGELSAMVRSLLSSAMSEADARSLLSGMSHEDRKMLFLGNKMISHYGCYACHNIPGFEQTTPPGTDLSGWAEKPITQLDFAFYNDAFHHMRDEKVDIYGHVYPLDADELNYWSPGKNPHEQINHTHAAFAEHKLLNPRIWDREKLKGPYDKLKMPNFYFTQEEAEALTTFLLSRIPPRVNDTLQVDYEGGLEGPIAAGRNLTRELNCVGCHPIEDNEPTIQQYFRRDIDGQLEFDSINAPPSLWGEGAKLQHAWFHSFLENVEPLRPWLRVRMPSFHLTGEQATTLVEYLAALSQQDAVRLGESLDPIDEYLSSTHEDGDVDAWFETENLAESASKLRQWVLERKLMRPSDLDMLEGAPERLRKAHGELLVRTEFMRDLYDVAYPFVEPPTPLSPTDRFELGRRFFNDMGCLSCHVLGQMLAGPPQTTDDFVQTYRLDGVRGEDDQAVAILNGEPYSVGAVIDGFTLISAENIFYDTGDVETKAVVEGVNEDGETERVQLQAASAPNLSLTHRRLRREWVYNWMLQPDWIQKGTKMPQNFADGKSPFEGDENYPGTSEDHINLLVDFLYDAGTTNARSPLKKITVVATDDDFDEDEDAEEEDFDD